jgi:hypothetical protein
VRNNDESMRDVPKPTPERKALGGGSFTSTSMRFGGVGPARHDSGRSQLCPSSTGLGR